MHLLLDTHGLLWWLENDPLLYVVVRVQIADERNDSQWCEIAYAPAGVTSRNHQSIGSDSRNSWD